MAEEPRGRDSGAAEISVKWTRLRIGRWTMRVLLRASGISGRPAIAWVLAVGSLLLSGMCPPTLTAQGTGDRSPVPIPTILEDAEPMGLRPDSTVLAGAADTRRDGPPSDKSEEAREAEVLPVTFNLVGRLQLRHTFEDEGRAHHMAVHRARVIASGDAYDRVGYFAQMALDNGEMRLLDLNVRVPVHPRMIVWVGQGKVPFGRQQLTQGFLLHFVDRGIADRRFAAPRQQGVGAAGVLGDGLLEYGTGVFTGTGMNAPGNDNRRLMKVGRLVLTPRGRLPLMEGPIPARTGPGEAVTRFALGVAGLRNTEGAGADQVVVSRANLEFALNRPPFNVVSEFFREWAEAAGGETTTNAAYGQVGYLFGGRSQEVAARYAVVRPDLPGLQGRDEVGLAYSRYLEGHRMKVQSDVRQIRDRDLDDVRREFRLQLTLIL